jgi:chemotaxis protein methyltransferase CheR
MRELQDIIFCRNVIIYFDRPTQEKVLGRLCQHLIPGGYLFMGHSETLSRLDLPLVSVGPMVYRKPL